MPDFENLVQSTDTLFFPEPPEKTCPATGYQKISVSVPVTIKPFAHVGKAKVTCCGNPVVVSGDNYCHGKKDDICTFTISQTICIEVPVCFGAKTKAGDTFVDCLNASANDICKDCKCAEHMEDQCCD